MEIGWISLAGLRSYQELDWRPEPGVNVLVGRNGAGKTNLLEAVDFLARLSSFRGAPEHALVAEGAETAVVRGEVVRGGSSTLIEIELRKGGGRRALVNRHRLVRATDLLGHLRTVTFLPDDLDIAKRGPAYRRDFLDDLAVRLWPGAYPDQTEYERALRQRNSFLKQGADDLVTWRVWDERLASAGGRVMARRARAVAELGPGVSEAYQTIAGMGGRVEFGYVSGWGAELDPTVPPAVWVEKLALALESHHRVDRDRRATTVGPHRDEPTLTLDGRDLRYLASQGEQRTVVLSLRLATHRAVSNRIESPAVLLLDDVFSELDPVRAEALAGSLPAAQTLVTTADRGDLLIRGRVGERVGGRVWTVADGKVI